MRSVNFNLNLGRLGSRAGEEWEAGRMEGQIAAPREQCVG